MASSEEGFGQGCGCVFGVLFAGVLVVGMLWGANKVVEVCPTCHGSGNCVLCSGTGKGVFWGECGSCGGKKSCPSCNGWCLKPK
jgi:hypothetical protein